MVDASNTMAPIPHIPPRTRSGNTSLFNKRKLGLEDIAPSDIAWQSQKVSKRDAFPTIFEMDAQKIIAAAAAKEKYIPNIKAARKNAGQPTTENINDASMEQDSPDDETWTTPKKTTPSITNLDEAATIITENQFAPLDNDSVDKTGPVVSGATNQAELNRSSNLPVKQNTKPPPIHSVHMKIKEFVARLEDKVDESKLTITEKKIKENCVALKIVCSDIDTHDNLIKAMREKGIEHYTFGSSAERAKLLLIKGLNDEYTDDEIKEKLVALQRTGASISKVKTLIFTKKFEDRVTEYHHRLVVLTPGSNTTELLKVKHIAFQSIKWEVYRKNNIFQCHNCLRPGHSSKNCGFPYRCVKCPVTHEYGKCPRDIDLELKKSSPPYCINCKTDGHSANYRGCPSLKEVQTKLNEWRRESATARNHANYQKFERQSHITYANSAGSNTRNSPQPQTQQHHTSYQRVFPPLQQQQQYQHRHQHQINASSSIGIELLEAVRGLTSEVKNLNSAIGNIQTQITHHSTKINFILNHLGLKCP